MLAADDVVHLVWEANVVLMDKAVFTALVLYNCLSTSTPLHPEILGQMPIFNFDFLLE